MKVLETPMKTLICGILWTLMDRANGSSASNKKEYGYRQDILALISRQLNDIGELFSQQR